MQAKAQSTIEFISTYSFSFLLISIILTILLLFASLPNAIIPTQCSFYSGLQCQDVIYHNTQKGSQLVILGSDTQPGTLNITSFSASIGSFKSNGYCIPSLVIGGDKFYCIANFTSHAVSSGTYRATFAANGRYCASTPTALTNSSCTAPTQLAYGGQLTTQTSEANAPNFCVVPITLANTQSNATYPGMQLQLSFIPSKYANCENSNLGNIRFYDGGVPLNSWCELKCQNTSIDPSIFWIKLDRSINAYSNTLLYMEMFPLPTEYDSMYSGEAPQLNPVYGEYDNGQYVFSAYANGDTLPSSFNTQNAVISQATGVHYSSGGGGILANINALEVNTIAFKSYEIGWTYLKASLPNQPVVIETNLEYVFSGFGKSSGIGISDNANSESSKNAIGILTGTFPEFSQAYESNGVYVTKNSKGFSLFSSWDYASLTYYGEGSASWNGYISGILYQSKGFGKYSGTVNVNPLSSSGSLYISSILNQGFSFGGTAMYYNWMRARIYPENGVMPTASFGNVITI